MMMNVLSGNFRHKEDTGTLMTLFNYKNTQS